MRRLRLFFGILSIFLFFSGSSFAQIKVSADTSKGVSGTAKNEAKAEPSSTAKPAAKAEVGAKESSAGTGISLKAGGTAQPATEAKATTGATAKAGAEATGTASAAPKVAVDTKAAVEPAQAAAGQTETSAEAEKPLDTSTYSVRLRDLEQRINELKEQVFRSKARLSLLGETILQGAVSGSQARLIHENKMGSSYMLVKAVYALDGAPIFNKMDEEGGLNDRETFDIYNGSMVPGEHTVTANLEYRGSGFGIFSYLKGYRFKVKSSYTFNAPESKAITVRVVSYEKGGPTAPLEDRPAIRYIERVTATGAAAETNKGGK